MQVAELSRQALGPDGSVGTVAFLAACSQVLPVVGVLWSLSSDLRGEATPEPPDPPPLSPCLCPPSRVPSADQLGAAFMLVRSDIHGNISRLEQRTETDPARFAAVFAIVEDEVARGVEGDSRSATKGLLWLKRYAALAGDMYCASSPGR